MSGWSAMRSLGVGGPVLFGLLLASPASPVVSRLPAQEAPQAATAPQTEVNAADLVKAADRAIGYAVVSARESDDPALSQANEAYTLAASGASGKVMIVPEEQP